MTPFHRDRPWFTSGSLLVFTVLCVSTRVPHGFPTESPPRPTCSPPLFPRPPAATRLLLLRGWLFPERRRAGVMQVAGAREERHLSSSDTRSRFPCLLAARQPLSLQCRALFRVWMGRGRSLRSPVGGRPRGLQVAAVADAAARDAWVRLCGCPFRLIWVNSEERGCWITG